MEPKSKTRYQPWTFASTREIRKPGSFHSGNTFLDSLINEQGNEPNLLRELKIHSTSTLPFQSPNPILRNLKRLKKTLLKPDQLNQVVLPTSADMDGFADLRSE
jgi:hypothetical protein